MSTCSGNGHCSAPQNCTCNVGYYGNDCSVVYNCFGKLSNNSKTCSGRGQCIENNKCTCIYGFYGRNCEFNDVETRLRPVNVTVSDISSFGMSLSWTAPLNFTDVSYLVNISSLTTNDVITKYTFDTNLTFFAGLKPSQNYTVSIYTLYFNVTSWPQTIQVNTMPGVNIPFEGNTYGFNRDISITFSLQQNLPVGGYVHVHLPKLFSFDQSLDYNQLVSFNSTIRIKACTKKMNGLLSCQFRDQMVIGDYIITINNVMNEWFGRNPSGLISTLYNGQVLDSISVTLPSVYVSRVSILGSVNNMELFFEVSRSVQNAQLVFELPEHFTFFEDASIQSIVTLSGMNVAMCNMEHNGNTLKVQINQTMLSHTIYRMFVTNVKNPDDAQQDNRGRITIYENSQPVNCITISLPNIVISLENEIGRDNTVSFDVFVPINVPKNGIMSLNLPLGYNVVGQDDILFIPTLSYSTNMTPIRVTFLPNQENPLTFTLGDGISSGWIHVTLPSIQNPSEEDLDSVGSITFHNETIHYKLPSVTVNEAVQTGSIRPLSIPIVLTQPIPSSGVLTLNLPQDGTRIADTTSIVLTDRYGKMYKSIFSGELNGKVSLVFTTGVPLGLFDLIIPHLVNPSTKTEDETGSILEVSTLGKNITSIVLSLLISGSALEGEFTFHFVTNGSINCNNCRMTIELASYITLNGNSTIVVKNVQSRVIPTSNVNITDSTMAMRISLEKQVTYLVTIGNINRNPSHQQDITIGLVKLSAPNDEIQFIIPAIHIRSSSQIGQEQAMTLDLSITASEDAGSEISFTLPPNFIFDPKRPSYTYITIEKSNGRYSGGGHIKLSDIQVMKCSVLVAKLSRNIQPGLYKVRLQVRNPYLPQQKSVFTVRITRSIYRVGVNAVGKPSQPLLSKSHSFALLNTIPRLQQIVITLPTGYYFKDKSLPIDRLITIRDTYGLRIKLQKDKIISQQLFITILSDASPGKLQLTFYNLINPLS